MKEKRKWEERIEGNVVEAKRVKRRKEKGETEEKGES